MRFTWRDRSRGETRYEVRRTGRRARLKANRRRFTDRRVKPATRYRYCVRACRRKRCARARRVTVRTRPSAPGGPACPARPGRRRVRRQPAIGSCPLFPSDNPWNTDVSNAPVDSSHDYIGSLGAMTLWPDFGGDGDYGIPYVSVPFTQPLVPSASRSPTSPTPGRTRRRSTRRSRAVATATC